jgi:2,4-dienoyl-CoA reductase-like NADH-dependent reductase (Old Yellow Enzyme family)
LGPLNLPNRIVMPPLVIWRSAKDGQVTDAHIGHYGRSAGPGLMIVEATCVSPEGRLAATQLGLWEDAQIPGMERLASTIADAGGIPGIQLHHAGAKATKEKTYGLTPVVPSAPVDGNPDARELSDGEIAEIIERFADAAARAVEAGFQLLEIHGAHGYLGSQFLSPRTNRRTGRYGGHIEARARFLRDVIVAVRTRISDAAVVSCRLGLAEAGVDGLSVHDGLIAAGMLQEAGAAALHISHGGSMPKGIGPADSKFSTTLHLSKMAKEVASVPVIGVGGIKTGAQADSALHAGFADLIAVGRGILADPAWARKALSGDDGDISVCVDCKPRCYHFNHGVDCPALKKLGLPSYTGPRE